MRPCPNRRWVSKRPGTALLVSVLLLSGCERAGSRILGTAPSAPAPTLAAARSSSDGAPVTVAGVMVEKCPEAGCWFFLEDGTGRVKVDTKTAGFVVVEVPLRRRMEVVGQWATNGQEVILAASGLRY